MLAPAALEYAACCARVFPGWTHVLDKNNISPINRIEQTWERIPKSFTQAVGTLDWTGVYSAIAMTVFRRITDPQEEA